MIIERDFYVDGRIALGSSRLILAHLRAKSGGKLGTGTVASHIRNDLWTAKESASGKINSLRQTSSSVGSRCSFLSSACYAASSFCSRTCRT